MRVRYWSRDLGLAICVVVAVSFAQLAGQVPARRYLASDLLGNFSPPNPAGPQWPVRSFVALAIDNLTPSANGNILFNGQPVFFVHFGEITSVPNNTGGIAPFTKFNPVGVTDEIVQPREITEGTCWSGTGRCQYVADGQTCSVYERHAQTGAIQRIVGTGACVPGALPLLVNGSNRLDAQFGSSSIVALGFTDAEGLLIGSCGTNRTAIFRSLPGQNTIEYLAGTGVLGAGSSGPATATAIGCSSGQIIPALQPGQNATSVDGVAFAVPSFGTVLRVSGGGMLELLAGDGTVGFSGDGGAATSAQMNFPVCLARHHAVYEICDIGNFRIRRVDNLTGVITTVAGNGSPGAPATGALALNSTAGAVKALAIDSAGNRYTADAVTNQIGVYSATTSVYSYVLPPLVTLFTNPAVHVPGNESPVEQVNGIARVDGPLGFEGLVLTDSLYPIVWFWNAATDRLSVFAGGAFPPIPLNVSDDGIPANQSSTGFPLDVVRTADGVTYIADGCRIRKVDTGGTISTVMGNRTTCTSAGDGGPAANATGVPAGLALAPDGRLFWSESGVVRHLALNGTVSRIAGNGTPGFSGDGGPATLAQIRAANDIDLSPDGRFLFIADPSNFAVRAVDLSLNPPIIATIAGTGGVAGESGDGGPANQATLRSPAGVSMSGNLLAIADLNNHRIRMVTFPPNASSLQALGSGVITTIFGTGTPGRRGRGVLDAVDARVNRPRALAPLPGPARGWFYSEPTAFTVGTLTEIGAPNAPSGFTATVSLNSVTMAWAAPDAGAPATMYHVLARLTPGGQVIAQLDVSDYSLIVDRVPNGTYSVSVRASNGFGMGPESSPHTLVVPQPVLPAGRPRNLRATVIGTTVTLNWLPPAEGGAPAVYYVAPSLTPGGNPITVIPIGAVLDPAADGTAAQATSFTAAGVPLGTYYVTLYAWTSGNLHVLGPPSNAVTVVVAPPNAPVMNAPVKAGTTVTFTWTPAAGPVAQSYLLTAALSPGGATVASVSTTNPSFTATGVPAGTYYIRVRAVSTAGQSGPSNEVALVVP